MFGCRSSRTSRQAYHLPRFYFLTYLYKVFALMTVKGFKTVSMLNDNTIAITEVGS